MEPMNCTLHVQADGCDVWLGTQVVARVQRSVAEVLGMPLDKVQVHNHLLGGGFGRRLEPDMAVSAARVAQHADGAPLKVVWTREEDIRHDYYRPLYRDVISATVANGRIASLHYKVCGASILARWLPPAFLNGIDGDAVDSAGRSAPTTSRTCGSSTFAPRPRPCAPASGAAWAATTTSSRSNLSSTRWPRWRARIRLRSGFRCSTSRRA
jgi:hypothetical protein